MDFGSVKALIWTCVVLISCNPVPGQDDENTKDDLSICDKESSGRLCYNGGRCIPNNSRRGYRCECPVHYTGVKCQQRDSCHSLPCENRGECINRKNGGYACRCQRPYEGKNCHKIVVNHCDSLPCQHGGECISNKAGFNCKCLPAYIGEYCQQESDVKEKCKNLTAKFAPKCCNILNKCCFDEPRKFVCGTWENGKHPVLYYNKCELKKARCLNLNHCILKRNESNCEVDHVKIMTRPTPCDQCPCQGMAISNQTLDDIVKLDNVRDKLNSNCTVECDNGPPNVPFCLHESLNRLDPKSIWDSL